jgi:drug/metabolite transporter (DMT)-like permease
MPLAALGLALIAALLHATWNVLLRGSRDVAAATTVVLVLSVILYAPVAALTWDVHAAARPYIAASTALETLYFFLLVAAYRRRELSVVYPIARGSAPVLVLVGSALVLGHGVTTGEAVGVCLVSAGVVFVRGIRRGAEGLVVGLAIGVAIASYTLVDKEGLHHASPLPYLQLVLIPVAAAAVLTFTVRRGTQPLRAQLSLRTLAAAAGSFGAYAIFLFALRLTNAPSVAAVRETSVLIAAGMAALYLRERVTRLRLAGEAGVAAGVILLAVS